MSFQIRTVSEICRYRVSLEVYGPTGDCCAELRMNVISWRPSGPSGKASSPVNSKNRLGGSCPDTLEFHIEKERRRRVEREVERRHRRLVVPRKQALMHVLSAAAAAPSTSMSVSSTQPRAFARASTSPPLGTSLTSSPSPGDWPLPSSRPCVISVSTLALLRLDIDPS